MCPVYRTSGKSYIASFFPYNLYDSHHECFPKETTSENLRRGQCTPLCLIKITFVEIKKAKK